MPLTFPLSTTKTNHPTTPTNNMKKHLLILCVAIASSRVFGGSVTLEDFDITAFDPAGVAYTEQLSALWGTYSAGVFTPLITSTPTPGVNIGYLLNADNEFVVNLTQGNNNNIAAGAPLFAAIFRGPSYDILSEQIVLSDPSWIAPTFTITTPELTWSLGASTVAMPLAQFGGETGTYSFNSPVQVTLVPEPSTYALLSLAGLALGGYAVRRRRRA